MSGIEPFHAATVEFTVLVATVLLVAIVFGVVRWRKGSWPDEPYAITMEIASQVVTFLTFAALFAGAMSSITGTALGYPALGQFGERLLVTLLTSQRGFLAVIGIAGMLVLGVAVAERWRRLQAASSTR